MAEPAAAGPIVVDTDIGGDPDDALAVTMAARLENALALVVTADERDGLRARFGRWLLDEIGRPEVPVVQGRQLGDTPYVSVHGLVPDGVPAQRTDVVAAVADLCDRTDGPVRWVGMGPMSNLADVLTARPDLTGRLVVSQMGGALRYRDPTRAEHNIRLDPDAARTVLRSGSPVRFVISDTTFTPEIGVSADSPIYRNLAAPGAPTWAGILQRHLDQWFATFHPSTLQHDALTLTLALAYPVVSGGPHRISLDGIGRMSLAADGFPVWLSDHADHRTFMGILERALDPSRT